MMMTLGFKLSEYKRLSSTDWARPIITVGGEEVTITSVDKDNLLYQNYPVLLSNGTRCSTNGKNPEGKKIMISHNIKPPIIDGRMVSDKTFALRFKNFLENIQVNDFCGEEELEYLQGVARDLLRWQVSTAIDSSEIAYLENNGIKKE